MNYGPLKQLSSYTLHATESIVYSAPTSMSAEVCSLFFHNSTGTTNVVQVWFPFTASVPTASYSGSNPIERLSENIISAASWEWANKVPFVLNSSGSTNYADKITMKATNSSSINVVIYGREQI